MDLLEVPHRHLRLGERVAGQPGREQHGTPVEAEGGHEHAKRSVPCACLIEPGKRRREVTGPEGDQCAVLHRIDLFKLLAGLREQVAGSHEIGIGAFWVPG